MTIKNFLKTIFGIDYLVREGTGGFINKENTMTARITGTNGTFALVNKTGTVIQTYARARDAKRGALRRGLTLVG
jgi:hypothetical protein